MKKLFDEVWKPVKGYEGLYEVSNKGNVRSVDRHVMCGKGYRLLKGKPMNPHPNSDGYLTVGLHKNNQRNHYLVHRLAADAFIPNPNVLPFIDHINTVRDDNRVENLKWCSYKENANNPLTKEHLICKKNKSVYYIDEQGNKISFKSMAEAARKIGCSPSSITMALKDNRPVYGIQFYFETEKVTIN